MKGLRELRYNRGFQRKFVASKVGISGKHLNDIEIGKVNLTDDVANRLSKFYGIGISQIKNMYKEVRNETQKYTKKTSATS